MEQYDGPQGAQIWPVKTDLQSPGSGAYAVLHVQWAKARCLFFFFLASNMVSLPTMWILPTWVFNMIYITIFNLVSLGRFNHFQPICSRNMRIRVCTLRYSDLASHCSNKLNMYDESSKSGWFHRSTNFGPPRARFGFFEMASPENPST